MNAWGAKRIRAPGVRFSPKHDARKSGNITDPQRLLERARGQDAAVVMRLDRRLFILGLP